MQTCALAEMVDRYNLAGILSYKNRKRKRLTLKTLSFTNPWPSDTGESLKKSRAAVKVSPKRSRPTNDIGAEPCSSDSPNRRRHRVGDESDKSVYEPRKRPRVCVALFGRPGDSQEDLGMESSNRKRPKSIVEDFGDDVDVGVCYGDEGRW